MAAHQGARSAPLAHARLAHGPVASAAHLAGSVGARSISASGLLLQLVVGLAVVIGLVFLTARVLRGRGGAGRGGHRGPVRRRPAVTVLGRQSLGKGVSVAVVQVAEQAYLLGVTPTSVRKVAALDPEHLAVSPEDPVPAPSWISRVPALASWEARWRALAGRRGDLGTARPAEHPALREHPAREQRRPRDGAVWRSSGQGRVRGVPAVLERTGDDATWTSAIAVLKERTRGA